ncbi:MAG: hypothetical protein Q9192_006217, partial [Flavoplaca navasiana]
RLRGFLGKKSMSQSDSSEKDRNEMLLQHDNFDVLSSEGLFKWQIFAINKLSGVQLKLSTEPIFRGRKYLTPAQKEDCFNSKMTSQEL